MVVEADEYDRSFLQLHPDLAVVSAIDEDHLDIYGDGNNLKETFAAFLAQLNKGGKAFLNEGIELKVPDYLSTENYGMSSTTAVKADSLRQEFGKMVFRMHFPAVSTGDMFLGMPGKYNVENALAAAAIVRELGVTEEQIRRGLNTYNGVKRRFEILVNTDTAVYVDDYAHHPRELEACITAARDFFPGRLLTGVFQPHLYSRTRDFADGFAESLKLLDKVILLDIYPAREKPIPGVSSAMLAEKIADDSVLLLSKEQVLDYVKEKKPECLLTLGAGDIDQIVEPVKTIMLNQ
jgi:UDP-N-acetylmuramate--alanine ligase